jgi:hypothetical protein
LPAVFFSYSHEDEALRDQLEKQLEALKRQGIIEAWHDRRIGAGENIHDAIDAHINKDEIILLLISPDFIASDYCYEKEMTRAMERHARGDAIVIPVILRACDWHSCPFGQLSATPRDGKPVTLWPDRDEAFLQVAKAVRSAAERLQKPDRPAEKLGVRTETMGRSSSEPVAERSSNLRLAKTFTQRDKDLFQVETFDFIARYFESSLKELEKRNPGYQCSFRRVDATRFFATVYQDGKDKARATIFSGGLMGTGIYYCNGETMASNTMNEAVSVDADDQTLFLTTMGMATFGQRRDQKLSQEGAAEQLWALLIGPLQQRVS